MRTSLISIARISFAIPLLIFGLMHLFYAKAMAAGVPAFIPGGVFWVYLTGMGLVAAAISFILHIKIKLAGFLLAAMLLIFIITIHIPGMMSKKPAVVQWSTLAMLKDFGLAAAALLISAIEMVKKK
jgi:putative oxidoreductase